MKTDARGGHKVEEQQEVHGIWQRRASTAGEASGVSGVAG
jgi:hypothetical protein